MPSPQDRKNKFNQAIDKSIKQELEKRHNILSELVEEIHQQKVSSSPSARTENSQQVENDDLKASLAISTTENLSENQQFKEKNAVNPELNSEIQAEKSKTKAVVETLEPNNAEKNKKNSESHKNKKTSHKKNESKLTGARPASWNVLENEAWKRYSPTARVPIFSSNNDKSRENNTTNKEMNPMKKFLSIIILVGALGLIIYYWSPWQSSASYDATVAMSSQSFKDGKAEISSEFAPGSEIYYKISHKGAFNSNVMIFEIYKITAEQKEELFKKVTEEDIDSKASVFTYLLRPDFFTAVGKYRVKVFLVEENAKKLISVKDFSIK